MVVKKSLTKAKGEARDRLNKASPGSSRVTPLELRAKQYDEKNGTRHLEFIREFLLKGKDGRDLFDWERFRDHHRDSATSSKEEKERSHLLWSIATADDHPMDDYGEWHHLWPLSAYGSVEDERNYRRVSAKDHVLAHGALAFFFPWIGALNWGFITMLNQLKISLEQFFDDPGMLEVVETARRVSAAKLSEVNQGNQYAKKAPSDDPKVNQNRKSSLEFNARKREHAAQGGNTPYKALKTGPKLKPSTGDQKKDKIREQARLKQRRIKLNRDLKKAGKELLRGPYTKEEIEYFGDLKYY